MIRARQWEKKYHTHDMLLQGDEVDEWDRWYVAAVKAREAPEPEALQKDYIDVSKATQSRSGSRL